MLAQNTANASTKVTTMYKAAHLLHLLLNQVVIAYLAARGCLSAASPLLRDWPARSAGGQYIQGIATAKKIGNTELEQHLRPMVAFPC